MTTFDALTLSNDATADAYGVVVTANRGAQRAASTAWTWRDLFSPLKLGQQASTPSATRLTYRVYFAAALQWGHVVSVLAPATRWNLRNVAGSVQLYLPRHMGNQEPFTMRWLRPAAAPYEPDSENVSSPAGR